MVDNRSTGFYGIGAFNFKSGDASGMANAMTDEKMGQGGEYFAQENSENEEEKLNNNEFVDRSAQLRNSLDSLALMNASNVVRAKKEADKKNEKDDNNGKKSKKSKKSLGLLVDDYEKH
ncbi:MAG: hypothetical protein LUE64_06615 [Candidatus Gastranaerophilales bacterium]|nr:hypothetical protein [Candidatus Gastranaerophilales bacterium]